MLIELQRQLHRLLHQRHGQLLLTLLAALWLALPLSATTQAHLLADAVALQQGDDHCAHHAQADSSDHSAMHHGSAHHGNNHNCHCAQACHASPVAIVTNSLSLPPPTHTAHPSERPQQLASTLQPPLYRPPIPLAA